MTHWGWKAPSNLSTTEVTVVTTEDDFGASSKISSKSLPPLLAGMDRAEAMAFVSRLFDSDQAGAQVWSDVAIPLREWPWDGFAEPNRMGRFQVSSKASPWG